jgi:uncharacterized protein (TIRG00374 family)
MKSIPIPRASYFVATDDRGRVRRPRDFTVAVTGLVLMVWAILAVDRTPAWSASFAELVASSPGWVLGLFTIGYLVSLVYALVVMVAIVFGRRHRRSSALRDLLIVTAVTLLMVVLISLAVNGEWPYVLPEIDLEDPVPRFPVSRVAMVTAVLLVASPYLTRPLRRVGWLGIVATAIAAIGLDYGTPIHALGSVGIGMFSAGLFLSIAGTPKGYPSTESVEQGLRALGTEATAVRLTPDQDWGVLRFTASDGGGAPLEVKVHGRDSFDSQVASKIWRTMWYRELGRTISFTRLQAVEHEALVTLLADRAGVRVPHLEAVGSPTSELSLVAFTASGVRVDETEPSLIGDEFLVGAWSQVAKLHEAGISHGRLDSSAVRMSPDGPVIADFGLGSLAPDDDDFAGDIVELLFSLSLVVGTERAVAAAHRGMGQEALVGALPYVQQPAVSAVNRRRTEEPKKVVHALKEEIVEVTGATAPEPVKLRRVTGRSVVLGALFLLLASALIPLFTSVDYAEIWDVLQSANWALLIGALLVGHLQYFPQATSTMCAVSARLPFWPLVILQTASQFISLAIPSSAGRVAMNAAFLHKFGMSIPTALAQGAIDGFSGFLVQAVILILILLVGDVDLGLDMDTEDIPWLLILGLAALVVIGVVIAVVRIRKLRDKVVPVLKQAWEALSVVIRQPSRALGLLFSNFVYWNILGITLWLVMISLGEEVGYGEALFVAAGTSLLAGFMPVPGGVGVAEATMTALLVTLGVDQSVAFAGTAAYRVITFYLPALEGLFGSRWLERNEYI